MTEIQKNQFQLICHVLLFHTTIKMVFGMDLWTNFMGKPEMTELEISCELLPFPTRMQVAY